MKKDKWGRSRKFKPTKAECGYRNCKKLFLKKVVQHRFCCDDHRIAENSLKSGEIAKKRMTKRKKKCNVEGCTNSVAKGLHLLCEQHYRNADESIFEQEHRIAIV